MIRINLLAQKRPKRTEKGQQSALAGVAIVVGAAAAVFFLIHQPLSSDVAAQQNYNDNLTKQKKALESQSKKWDKLEAAFKAAQEQKQSIDRLKQARAVPAWMLHELSVILTKDRNPTMSREMEKKVRDDPNRSWTQGWDPKHVWITAFQESGGRFRLEGGAQSDGDMTQLALRLQASVYFADVLPEKGDEVQEKGTGVSYYTFTITGTVVY